MQLNRSESMRAQSTFLNARRSWLPVLLALTLLDHLPAQQLASQQAVPAPRTTEPNPDHKLIRLKVLVADLDVDEMQKLGIDWQSHSADASDTATRVESEPPVPMPVDGAAAERGALPPEPLVAGQPSRASQRVVDANGLKTLEAALEALANEGAAKLLSQPQVVTPDGRSAAILVGGEVKWRGHGSSMSVRTLPIGLRVVVTPTVANDAAIELDLILEYGEMQVEAETAPGVPRVQAYDQRRVMTRIKLPPRHSGVIRYGLRSRNHDAPDRERLIVLTPEIVKPLSATEAPQSAPDLGADVVVSAPLVNDAQSQVWSPKPRSSASGSSDPNAELRQLFQQIYPNESIQIFRARDALILRGTIDEASEIPGIVEIAEQFAPTVINQLRAVSTDETAAPGQQVPQPTVRSSRKPAAVAPAGPSPLRPFRNPQPPASDPFQHEPSPVADPFVNPQPSPRPRIRSAPESEIHQLRSEVRALRQDVQTLIRLLQQRTRQPAVAPPLTPVEPASQPATKPNAATLQLRTYNVADLVVPIPQFGEADQSIPDAERSRQQDQAAGLRDGFDKLVNLITSTIQPDSWESPSGGAGRIIPHESTLSIVVRQTPTVHQLIEELLEQLRRLQDWQVGIESRVIRSQDLPQRLSNSQRDVLSHQGWVVVSTDLVRELTAAENVLAMPKVTLFNGQQVRLVMPRGDHSGSGELNCQLAAVVGPERRKVRLSLTVGGVSIREASLSRQATLLVRIPSNELLKDLPEAAGAKLFKQPGEQRTAYLLMSPQIIHQVETDREHTLPKTRS